MLKVASSMLPIADSGESWDATAGLLGVPNGVVDLRTGKLRDGRPDDRITMHAGVEYDPHAECPRWERLNAEVCSEDAALVAYLKRMAGYTATGEANLALLLFLMGVGSNGKSLYLKVLTWAFGDYAYSLPAKVLLSGSHRHHPTEIAGMEGKRLVTCAELGSQQLDADRCKVLSGGDEIPARRMYRDARDFSPSWQLWLTSNELPRSDDNTVGYWRRVRANPFERQFDPAEEPDLEDTLRSELPGILRWIVEGARDYYDDGRREGPIPESVKTETDEYREEMDPLRVVFDAGYLEEIKDAWTSTEQLHSAYAAFANLDDGKRVPLQFRLTQDGLGRKLRKQFARKRPTVARDDGTRKQLRGFIGVAPGPNAPANAWAMDAEAKRRIR